MQQLEQMTKTRAGGSTSLLKITLKVFMKSLMMNTLVVLIMLTLLFLMKVRLW